MMRIGMTYKRIQWPSAKLRTWLLVPAVIVLILLFILRPKLTFPLWSIVIGGLSLGSYLAVMTYACIKQKCYMQLARTWLTILMGVATFLAIRYGGI